MASAPIPPISEPSQTSQTMRTSTGSTGGVLATIGDLFGYVLFPLTWIGRLFVFRVSERQGNQVALFTSFSGMIYTWPIIVAGFVCAALPVSLGMAGWLWIGVVVFVLLVLGTDINRNMAAVWGLVILLIFTGGALINIKYHIPVLGNIYSWFEALNVSLDRGTVLAMSVLLTIVLIVVFIYAAFDGRHEISSREVTHRRLLRTSESLPLTVNRVRLDWPDMLEMMTLFGAGHLVIIDNTGKEVMRIPNIPFLWFYRDEVNRILDIMATTEVAPQVLDANA